MKLELIWSEFAENQLDDIYEYYCDNVNMNVAQNIIESLLNEPKKLITNPYIGQLEDLLKERGTSYRYIIFKSYKIIYSVDQKNGYIKIADVFDTRQYPEKMGRAKD